jgi:hypothetical protein
MRSQCTTTLPIGHALGNEWAKHENKRTVHVEFADGKIIELLPITFGTDWIVGTAQPSGRREFIPLWRARAAWIDGV